MSSGGSRLLDASSSSSRSTGQAFHSGGISVDLEALVLGRSTRSSVCLW